MAATNRIFFPATLLDAWIADERVELTGDELLLKDEGRRYRIVEGVHILRDAAGGGDTRRLIGKVKSKEQLAAANAEVMESSMVVGDDAYDVVPGFLGEPVGAFSDRRSLHAIATPNAHNDEELLAQFLMKSL